MQAIFQKNKLLVLLQDFYTLTGLRAVIFDAWGTDILSYPNELPAFCTLVRQDPKGREGCMQCDQNACRLAQEEKSAFMYACHAGLLEIIAPIEVDNTAIGYLLLSHIVQGADEEAEWKQVQQRCSAYSIDPHALQAAYRQLPRTGYPVLKAAADLLSLAAKSIFQAQLASLAPGSPADRLSRYLSEHLTEELPSEKICKALSISRTRLYHLSRETYGCGISEHITRLRIQKAIHLLRTTSLTNSEICQQVGIHDYNYFFRVFRKCTGLTPRDYRSHAREREKIELHRFSPF